MNLFYEVLIKVLFIDKKLFIPENCAKLAIWTIIGKTEITHAHPF
jgi:hypothetical protein